MADNQHYVIDDGQNKIPGYTKTEVDELIESGAKAWSGTQAEYNALKAAGLLQPRSLYIITDAANLNGTAADLSFDGSATTTKQAIDGKANKTDIDSYNVRKYTTSWGTTCQTTLGRYQFIVLRGFTPYVVWLASTNDINVANIASNTSSNGTGSVTFDNVVFTRLSNNNLKVELPSNGTITIFG